MAKELSKKDASELRMRQLKSHAFSVATLMFEEIKDRPRFNEKDMHDYLADLAEFEEQVQNELRNLFGVDFLEVE